jgi:hypothetical protein
MKSVLLLFLFEKLDVLTRIQVRLHTYRDDNGPGSGPVGQKFNPWQKRFGWKIAPVPAPTGESSHLHPNPSGFGCLSSTHRVWLVWGVKEQEASHADLNREQEVGREGGANQQKARVGGWGTATEAGSRATVATRAHTIDLLTCSTVFKLNHMWATLRREAYGDAVGGL